MWTTASNPASVLWTPDPEEILDKNHLPFANLVSPSLTDFSLGFAPGNPRPTHSPLGPSCFSLGKHSGSSCHLRRLTPDLGLGCKRSALAKDSAVTQDWKPSPISSFKATFLFIYLFCYLERGGGADDQGHATPHTSWHPARYISRRPWWGGDHLCGLFILIYLRNRGGWGWVGLRPWRTGNWDPRFWGLYENYPQCLPRFLHYLLNNYFLY